MKAHTSESNGSLTDTLDKKKPSHTTTDIRSLLTN